MGLFKAWALLRQIRNLSSTLICFDKSPKCTNRNVNYFYVCTRRLGSVGQNTTFSEHGHVAYEIKENQECSNMVDKKTIIIIFRGYIFYVYLPIIRKFLYFEINI